MKILILGSGGREHAMAWKLAQSSKCEQLFIAPGNAGTAQLGTNVPIGVGEFEAQYQLVKAQGIHLVIVGPEQPLVDGVVDFFEEKGIPILGPSKQAAQLEGSKDFSKQFMLRHGIPTAQYASFTAAQMKEAQAYVSSHPLPIVVKASGLAAGKGVLICQTHAEAEAALKDMLSGQSFGEAGETVVIEEYLDGIEISIFVLSDGSDYKILPSAKDYKRIGEGDTGLNTGGMGAVSPVPFADEAFLATVEESIVHPSLTGLQQEGIPFKGFLFIGLMVIDGQPFVLEYNVRMGDPETEVVLPRLDADFASLCMAAATGQLRDVPMAIHPQTCVTVMMVSGGYPQAYAKGKVMKGFEGVSESILFHAGTKAEGEQIFTNGGRVLAISSLGDSIEAAVQQSLQGADMIQFDGKNYRRDIGKDLMG
ncbi:MAG: phosphoribosylamine--glycine ligase [Bacteroidota bacterium]